MLHPFLDAVPRLDDSVFIAESAQVIGDVHLGPESSVWFNAVVRGDVNWIRIGARSNIQDNAVVHVTNRTAPTLIGDRVTVGHSAVVHGCTVEDDVLVGIGAVILDHAVIGHDSLVGARALVTGGTRIPPRSLVLGSPARAVRSLTDEEVEQVHAYARNYVGYARIYRGVDQPARNPFYDRA
jgi:carbonic anhydrase/acetyltransferase-like protein (isoleucine patch superfamily)